MDLLKFVMFCQMLKFGAQNLTTPAAQTTLIHENTHPRVIQLKETCTWTLQKDPGSKVILTDKLRSNLTQQICQALSCGAVDTFSESLAPPNSTCLSHCLRVDQSGLEHCLEVVQNDCRVLSKVICEHNKARLVGGNHRCGGRVELRQGGQWGTVCDDDWDLSDANIVCAQLGCGYAIMATGQESHFGPGTGSILLDELNCTGREGNLWECPAQKGANDCGHKEDAGVVCSEFKDVRLTGGLDRCSGLVEIHRNGTWGTVCDTCWGKEEANMACSMLNCGKAVKFSAFFPHFPHGNTTKWYYHCVSGDVTLWDCREFANHKYFCTDSKAAGLICSNSLGLPQPSIPENTTVARPPDVSPSKSATLNSWRDSVWLIPLSPELLACVVLSGVLLIAMITNAVTCCCHRRKYEFLLQQSNRQLQCTTERQENEYREGINLVNITSNNFEAVNIGQSGGMCPPVPHYYPQSSVDTTLSSNTDCDGSLSVEPAHPLSTFRNSRKYSSERTVPSAGVPHMTSVSEEASNPVEDKAKLHSGHYSSSLVNNYQPNRTSYAGTASVDSFDSSSTSSGECYENTGTNIPSLPASEAPIYDQTYDHFLLAEGNQDGDHRGPLTTSHTCSQEITVVSPSSGEDSPIYSPVSMEPPEGEDESSDCDYDDVVNYMQ